MTTDLTFITNDRDGSLQDRFNVLVRSCKAFNVLVGYFFASGFNTIKESPDRTAETIVVNESFHSAIGFAAFVAESSFRCLPDDLSGTNWSLLPPPLMKIKRKMEDSGSTLRELGAKIRLGIATGANEAFVIDGTPRQSLIAQDPRSADIIKPLIRGKDIRRWSYIQDDSYILLTKNGIDVEKEYLAIFRHLASFDDTFRLRGAKGRHWSNLRPCAFLDDFLKPKIVWIELTDRGRFALCEAGVYLLNTAYYMLPPGDLPPRYLLALLNSRSVQFYLNAIAQTSGMGVNRWFNNYVREFHIPISDESTQQLLSGKVDQILDVVASSSRTPQTTASEVERLERDIDQIVYQLYGLDGGEVALLEQYLLAKDGA